MECKKAILLILDGWGIGDKTESNVVYKGDTPYWNSLLEQYPHSKVLTSGEDVGLPAGQMGNSEVGHLNIGAGRILYQDLVRINKEIENNKITQNPKLVEAFNYAKKENKQVHLLGLVSDGGVHSSENHLYKLCDVAQEYGLEKVFVHAFTDGRDTDPKSGLGFITNLHNHLKNSAGEIASIVGRYYAMDRDNRWDRIKKAYDLLVAGKGEKATDPMEAMKNSYNNDITDEFVEPTVITNNSGQPKSTIQEGDVVICFNFRTDRLRQMTTALSQKDMPEYGLKALNLKYYTMTKYDESFKGVGVLYDKENVQNTMGEVLAKLGKKQIRIAETEKYAHVTFFFSGGREEEFEGEKRILIPSPKVATYDLKPEMSAYEVADTIVEEIKTQEADFICLNFANGDMVGHTGIYEAIQKAVKAVDNCLKKVVEAAKENGYETIITADHGNADFAVNADGSPNTAHTTNPVPCVLVSDRYDKVKDGILADIAPTLLKLMDIEQPVEMIGKPLV